MQSRIEFFQYPSPTYIQVADKPLCYPDAQISKIGLEEIKEQFNFEYFENITIDRARTINKTYTPIQPIVHDTVHHRLRTPLNDSLVVCKLEDPVGYGLFTQRPIKCGDIIGIYAGEMDQQEYRDPVYTLGSGKNQLKAIKKGGLCRFIQHMPLCIYKTLEQLHQADNMNSLYILSSILSNTSFFQPKKNFESIKQSIIANYLLTIKKEKDEEVMIEDLLKRDASIAHANTAFVDGYYNEFRFTMVIAMHDIEPNEQLGISYGMGYWNTSAPLLFKKQTGKISKWSDIYQFLFIKNPDVIANWSWLYRSQHYRHLFTSALKSKVLVSTEINSDEPEDIRAFLDLNQIVLQEFMNGEDILKSTVIVPIKNKKLWVSLLKRKHNVSFLPDEMTHENIKDCVISLDLLQSMTKLEENCATQQYLKKAHRLYATLLKFRLLTDTSIESLEAPLDCINAENTAQMSQHN